MKTVLINGRFLSQPITGVQRFAREVVTGIDDMLGGGFDISTRFELLVPRNARNELTLRHIGVRRIGRLRGVAWEMFELAWAARNGVLLNLGSTGTLLHPQQIVTIHDAAAFRIPQNYSFLFRSWYRVLLPLLARRARLVLTVSQFSKRELSDSLRIDPDKITVVHNSAAHILRKPADESVLDRHKIERNAYLLCVGGSIANKNAKLVLDAMRLMDRSDLMLVRAGKADPGVFADLSLEPQARFRDVGTVTDAQLRALYENAFCLVFPSLYEGFGIPPLEAMACGCAVIASSAAALPETCGDAALYCDPYDPADLVAKIRSLRSEPRIRQRLIAAGTSRAESYTWQACVAKIIAKIQEINVP